MGCNEIIKPTLTYGGKFVITKQNLSFVITK